MGSRWEYKNNEMVDCLMHANRIRTRRVERVFRAVDRGEYVIPDERHQAYLQQPWRNGMLHLSAPCIYGEVLEALELKAGQSFLNVGSGTGYFSTLVGLIIGCSGINHGIEVFPYVVDYANAILEEFIESSPALNKFDFCAPKFQCGNGLCLGYLQQPYDRVYCGADCPPGFLPYFKRLIKIGGLLVLPAENRLLQIKRTSVNTWTTKSLLHVSFATLRLPTSDETAKRFTLEWTCPQRLQILSYAAVRKCMRVSQLSRLPLVFEALLRCPRPTDFEVNEFLRHILSMDQYRENPLPLSGFPSKKSENVFSNMDDDHIKSNASDLTLNNVASTSCDENKSPKITVANKELSNITGVQKNKSPLLPLIKFLPNANSTIKSDTTSESSKELENKNRVTCNTLSASQKYTNPEVNKIEPAVEGSTSRSDVTSKKDPEASVSENVFSNMDDDHIKSNASDLTLNNVASTSCDENKSPKITVANKELSNITGVQKNKSPLLPLIKFLPNANSIIKSHTTSESSKELENKNRVTCNTLSASQKYTNPEVNKIVPAVEGSTSRSDVTSNKDPEASVSEHQLNTTETNKNLEKKNGIQENTFYSLMQSLQVPINVSLKETTTKSGLTLNNLDASDKVKSLTSATKEAKKIEVLTDKWSMLSLSPDSEIPTNSKMRPFDNPNKGSEKKKEEPTPENSHLTPPKLPTAEKKKIISKSYLTLQKQSKGNITAQYTFTENFNKSGVYIFGGNKNKDTSSSSESVPSPLTENSKGVTESVPVDEANSTCEQVGKDIRMSILIKQGTMEIHLPSEQKESTNIIFTKMHDKALIDSDAKSTGLSQTGDLSTTQLVKSKDEYKSDILARLQNTLSPIPLKKELSTVFLRISFKTLNYYTDWIWDSMMMTTNKTFEKLDSNYNKAIFQKGALLIAEAKVAFAQRNFSQTCRETLTSKNIFTDKELVDLKEMASKLPLPLAVYLECLGNTYKGDQMVTPILAEHPNNKAVSGAPHLMLPLFHMLRLGRPLDCPLRQHVLDLDLPMLHWEEFKDATCGAQEGSSMIRITEESFNFWVKTRKFSSVIKWDAEDYRTFKHIISSLDSKPGFIVAVDISHGMGSQAQFVHTIDYKVDNSIQWFTKIHVDDYLIKLGAAFAFNCSKVDLDTNKKHVKYLKGTITPRMIMFAILCSVYHF